jgi:hypothetical protein
MNIQRRRKLPALETKKRRILSENKNRRVRQGQNYSITTMKWTSRALQ